MAFVIGASEVPRALSSGQKYASLDSPARSSGEGSAVSCHGYSGSLLADNWCVERRHAAIIYNPVHSPLGRLRDAVDAQERLLGWGPSMWFKTAAEDAGRQAACDAAATAPDVMLVAGGDGTIRTVVEAVRESGVPIAPLPVGTGNLLARNLSLPLTDLERSIEAAFTGADQTVDVGLAELEHESGDRTSHVFLVMAGMGLDAAMAENTSRSAKKRLGWLAYVAPIARSIIANQLFHLDYRIDGGRVKSTRAHTIIVGNCGTLTGNMLLIPAAVVDDGLLDVVAMRPTGFFSWARIGTRLTVQDAARRLRVSSRMHRRRRSDFNGLTYAQGKKFEARFETPHAIELDGDLFGNVTRVRITVQQGALRLRTPALRR